MKILILGTSNSLLRDGWVSGLKNALRTAEITNRSIGASPGTQFGAMLDIEFSSYDYVFFDSMPNDQEYYHSGDFSASTDLTQQAIYEIAATISSHTRLIITAISKIDYLNTHEYVYRQREKIAAATGAQFLDFKDILNHLHALVECDISLLYETPTHPASFLMKQCGELIGSALLAPPDNAFCASKLSFTQNFSWEHLGEKAKQRGDTSAITITNSLMSETFLTIEHPQQISFNTNNICLGFYINFRGTNAYINLHSADSTAQLNLAARILKDKLLKIFIPTPNGSTLERISLDSNRGSECVTPIPHNRKATWAIEHPTISIATILFWNYRPFSWQRECEHYHHDYRWLTNTIKRGISKTALSAHGRAQTAAVHLLTHFGRRVMYDRVTNRCIQTHKSLQGFYPNQLLPVHLKFIDSTKVHLTTEVDGIEHTLSGFSSGISINNSLIGKGLKDKIDDHFLVEFISNNKIALKCGQFYLRASKLVYNGGLTLDRVKADAHETFEVNKIS